MGKAGPAINGDCAIGQALYLTGKAEGYGDQCAWTLLEDLQPGELKNIVNNTGNNLLNLAAGSSVRCAEKVCILLKSTDEANFPNIINHKTKNQSTALHHAASRPSPNIFNLYLDYGATTWSDPDKGGNTPISIIQDKLLDLDPQSEEAKGWLKAIEYCQKQPSVI
ncbi:hypothetical protein [Endozoicomonas sp.]|uniref:hypothetical protein n=1 Tax=Endozoicomonas sp. TaxID=1892382 RepID=UPI003AF69A14